MAAAGLLWWLALAAAIASGFWIARRARERLVLLARFAESVAAGATRPPLPVLAPGALGRLQRALGGMAVELEARLASARSEQRRLEAVLDGMVEGVLVIDDKGTVLLSNRRAEALLDVPGNRDYVGRSLIELTRHPDLHDLVRWMAESRDWRRSTMREIALDVASQHVLQVTVTPIEAGQERPSACILVFHDISQLKRLERIRRDFVANVSHELRTPLAAIAGYTETLLGGAIDDPDKGRRFLGIVERHTERLGRLVDDLLVLSDLELGRTELRRGEVRAEAVVEATFEILRHKATSAGIVLEQEIAAGVPSLDADEDRLEQALVNLVDNAIKYSAKGGRVKVSARRAERSRVPDAFGGRDYVEVTVADTGVGVPAEDLPRLTERFYRVDKARSRELGGTGLGLAIVKHIVQAHRGWMKIESQLNHGTTVRLFLPEFAHEPGEQHAA